MSKAREFVKKEIVLILSFVLAVVSACLVGVDGAYADYVDYRTLVLLFCLMGVTSALNRQGVFVVMAQSLLRKVHSTRALGAVFCMLCFFLSMLITNDVALITFVPFTVMTLRISDCRRLIIPVVTLETISANLGSMLTPIGNPQNLYLFSKFNMSIGDFISAILPYAVLSLVLVLAMLTVFRVVPCSVLICVVVVALLVVDRRALLGVDYSLLLTFVFLFVFIGNLSRMPSVNEFLGSVILGREVPVGIVASQVLSNVPAAILLSGFSSNAHDLLIGVNLGGLGTLIASMASLISFKFVSRENVGSAKYIAVFTVMNVVFLACNVLLWIVVR